MGLIGARKEDPACLTFTYGSTSKLERGVKTNAEMANPGGAPFKMTLDEPASMPGGTNAGPNPLDLVCASLGTCQEITYKLYATVMDVPKNSISAKVSHQRTMSHCRHVCRTVLFVFCLWQYIYNMHRHCDDYIACFVLSHTSLAHFL